MVEELRIPSLRLDEKKKFWVIMLKDHTNFSLIEDEAGKPTLADVLELNKDNEDDSVRNYKEGNYVISDESYTLKSCGEFMAKVSTDDMDKKISKI